jgi:hypothetical protein
MYVFSHQGFQLWLSVPVKEIKDITPFSLNESLFYGMAGLPTSVIAEGYIAGAHYSTYNDLNEP